MIAHISLRFSLLAAMAIAATACTVTTHDNRLAVAQLEIQSQRVSLAAKDVALGKAEGFAALEQANDALQGALDKDLARLEKARAELVADASHLMKFKGTFAQAQEKAQDLDSRFPVVSARIDEVVKVLTDDASDKKQVVIASRLMLLVDRMRRNAGVVLKGSSEGQAAADSLQRDSRLFSAIAQGLVKGNEDLGVKAMKSAVAKDILAEVDRMWTEQQPLLSDLLGAAADLQDLNETVAKVESDSDMLAMSCEALLKRAKP